MVRILLIVATATDSLASSAGAPRNGLLITHVNSRQWQLRLIAGSAAQQFSGMVESSTPNTAVSSVGVQLESADSAKLLSPTTLSTTLGAWPGGFDGVDFSVSADTKLCLRNSGRSAVQIYLGDRLANVVPVNAPVQQNYIASAVAPLRVLMGGPDVRPDNPKLLSRAYPFYDEFDGQMRLFGQVQAVCYGQLHATSG